MAGGDPFDVPDVAVDELGEGDDTPKYRIHIFNSQDEPIDDPLRAWALGVMNIKKDEWEVTLAEYYVTIENVNDDDATRFARVLSEKNRSFKKSVM